ncbi:hypothetical protein IPA_02075 [Ignicoccus pacificus DSM 13166]|uniref:tRNA intron endonuclease catalytic domain-containing protein n=1 Tax=Ignicoccus pacificus DSM 13166 TaxID=940294 RepID=A0A977PJV2_9CREN|nr:hypothetical protein IPA_02075 [Ignicoccus pacificus DSM 13166]
MIEIRLLPTMEGKAKREGLSSLIAVRGTGEEMVLHPLEVAYILFMGEGKAITEDGRELDFNEYLGLVLKTLEERCEREGVGCVLSKLFWSMFTVYYDLRKRKRKVIPEVRREGTLLEIRRNKWWAEYLVLEEGVEITIDELLSWVEDVRANDLNSIVAIVDRNGSVTYYETSKATLRAPRSKPSEGDQLFPTSS